MANKTYSIVINGLEESVKAVDALNSSLAELEKKIKALEGKAVKVGPASSGGGSKSSSTGALSEEEKIQKQIEILEEKRVAHSKEIYQNYLAAKDVLKEVDKDQKSIAATERLQANSYSNTIQGMKQELADIKSAMQTVDLGDSDQLNKMTQRANELNDALKKIEESYGQFGRNVGNYASAADGFQKIAINVGGVTREFNSAREASRELSNELKTMAINGQQGTKEFKDLQVAVAKLSSDMKDATVSSSAMDNMLDTMQSFASIGSITQGFSSLFGFDDTEIEKSIQKLVALQNVMQGIEKLNQQINSGEGIGGWLSKGNAAVDSFVEKITGANKAQEALNASTTAGKTASQGLAAAQTAQAAATTTATVATKALSVALKTIGIGLVISAVATLITYWKDIYKWLTNTIPVLKNLGTWFDRLRAIAVGVGSALFNYIVQPIATVAKTIKALIEGNFSDIPKIIADGFKNSFNAIGNFQKGYYKEIERQQTEYNKKIRDNQKKANEEQLKDEEAKYGTSHKRTQDYLKKQMELTEKGSDEYKELQRKLWEDERKEREENNKKSLSSTKKNNREILEAERDLNNLRISNMKEGLNKVLIQLEEERKQRLAKVEADGIMVGERQAEINKLYDKKILDAKKKHVEDVQKTYRDMWDNIYNYSIETQRKLASIASLSGETARQGLEQISYIYDYRSAKTDRSATSSYGVQGKNQLSKETQEILGLEKEANLELSKIYKEKIKLINDYWTNRTSLESQNARNNYNAQLKVENDSYQKELRDSKAHYDEMIKTLDENHEKGLIEDKEYYDTAQRLLKEWTNRDETINKEHSINIQKLEQDKIAAVQNSYSNFYNDRLQELRDFQTAVSNLESKQPVYNSWGIINLKETKKNNQILYDSYKELARDIATLKDSLQERLDNREISFDNFQNANRELDRFAEDVGFKMDKVKRELTVGDQVGKFVQSIEMYVQAGLQAVQTVMSAIDDYQDYEFDKLQDEIDKENEMLQKKLDAQEEIINKHQTNVNSIEDELANSRGDRRQHLIDQLNAEMEAEREAAKEKQRIEREQEKLDKKQEQLEKKRRIAEYERNLRSILLSTAMATANGLATQPFVPVGIAMGALATSLGMVQYALAKQQKPYARGGQLEGGIAQGPRHRDGGIPVLGGRASIEGGEFITNRLSTANNIDLLEFINSKKKKVDISDLIDFYSSSAVRKNISNIKTKFEDGGQITLPSTIDVFDNKVITALDAYSNRPIYVTVTDIENRMEQVKYVRTLAGLS